MQNIKAEDDNSRKSNDFFSAKSIEGLEMRVTLGSSRYIPHNKCRDEFTPNLATYEEYGRRENPGKIDVN